MCLRGFARNDVGPKGATCYRRRVGLHGRLIVIVSVLLALTVGVGAIAVVREHDGAQRDRESAKASALLMALSATLPASNHAATAAQLVTLEPYLSELGLAELTLKEASDDAAHANVLRSSVSGPVATAESTKRFDAFVDRAIASSVPLLEPAPPAWPRFVSAPVQRGARVGTLVAVMDVSRAQNIAHDSNARLKSVTLGAALLLLVGLLLALHVELVRPVRTMLEVAQRMVSGDFSGRARVLGGGEVRELAASLNDAARLLRKTHVALEGAVLDRTMALENKNDELARANEALEKLALTDALTGLPNRRYLEQALAFEVTRQKRQKRPFSLLMIDVDHFKSFNDQNGHPAGDEVLKNVAQILSQSLRKSDVVARVGGEEFVVLLLDTALPLARVAAEKVRAAVESHAFTHGETQPGGRLTISLGLASYPMHGAEAQAVLAASDRGLYVAKLTGRNRVGTPEDA